jgi:hypothetical protein
MDRSNRLIARNETLNQRKYPIYTSEFSCFFARPPLNNDFAPGKEFHGIVTLGMENS